MKRGKKAISEVVIVVLIVLVSIAAVLIFYSVVRNLITDSGQGLGFDKTLVSLDIQTVTATASTVDVKLSRNSGDGTIDFIKFVFVNSTGDSYTNDSRVSIGIQETKTYSFDLTSIMNPASVSSVKVYPMFINNKGEEIVGTEDVKIITPSVPTNCTLASECPDQVCKTKACTSGSCVYTSVTEGTSCTGGGTCQSGVCVPTTLDQCAVDADCDDTPPACQEFKCLGSPKTCQLSNLPAGQQTGCNGIGDSCNGLGSCVSSLVLWMDMDDNVLDNSLNNNSGTWINSPPRYEAGKFGNAAVLNKIDYNDKIISSKNLAFDSSKKYTFSFWLKTYSSSSQLGEDPKIDVISSKSGTNGWAIGMHGSNGNRMEFAKDGSDNPGTVVMGTSGIVLNSWQHVAIVYDNGVVSFYQNGATNGGGTISLTSSSTNLTIAPGSIHSTPGNMSLDDLVIFNDTLTQTEITSLFNTPYS